MVEGNAISVCGAREVRRKRSDVTSCATTEVRLLALSVRNYVRELWNFMYGVSLSKYANSIRPFYGKK